MLKILTNPVFKYSQKHNYLLNCLQKVNNYNYSCCPHFAKSVKTMGSPLKEVLRKLEKLAPLKTAESWDNVGLLVELADNINVNSLLVTIDLTEDVVQEAVSVGAQLIISYHPNIFRPLKTVTQSSCQERILTRCHGKRRERLVSLCPAGMGRFVTLTTKITLREAIDRVKRHIGTPYLKLGFGRAKDLESPIECVALCAGSGASVLNGHRADLYLTGEMSHHEVLDATQQGISVILCNHSDSDRGYLKTFQKLFFSEHLIVHISRIDKDVLTTV